VVGLGGANSMEFDKNTPYAVIDLMPDQKGVMEKGGTMRLGAYPCVLLPGSLAADVYTGGVIEAEAARGIGAGGGRPSSSGSSLVISERHRHRYEVSNKYREIIGQRGLVFSGTSPDQRLVEMVELRDHPYFLGCQFHPEFKSRPHVAHPLFSQFVRAALERQRERAKSSEKPKSGEVASGSNPPVTTTMN